MLAHLYKRDLIKFYLCPVIFKSTTHYPKSASECLFQLVFFHKINFINTSQVNPILPLFLILNVSLCLTSFFFCEMFYWCVYNAYGRRTKAESPRQKARRNLKVTLWT